jgi:WD40 repeat protein
MSIESKKHLPKIPAPPPAFLCTFSHQIMSTPLLSLCGHLFDKNVIGTIPVCPIDGSTLLLKNCIPFKELQQQIEMWKAHFLVRKQLKPQGPDISQPISFSKKKEESKEDGDVQEVTHSFSKMGIKALPVEQKVPAEEPRRVQPLKIVRNAHDDDIHGLLLIAPDLFVSGSKDNSLKMWNGHGELITPLLTESAKRGYKYWVTALGGFSNGLWSSGTRDGYITIWDQKGNELSTLQYNPTSKSQNQYVCKERNKCRINCITEATPTAQDQMPQFYTGTPKYIQLWDGNSGQFVRGYKASNNDWVYCIEVLDNHKLIVVIGSDLEIWDMKYAPPQKEKLIQEGKEEHHAIQRPHISSITRLEHNKNILALALFGGSVKLVDIVAQRLLCDYREHVGRVWSVTNLHPQVFASSADDRTIKIWDVREPKKSIFTIGGNPGRVSVLLRLSEQILISGSCPDDVFASKEKASLSFWDIRQLC